MVDPEPDCSVALRFHMRGNARLSVRQLLMLIDDPTIIDTLGAFAPRARAQIAALGDFKATSAPPEVTAHIIDAARRSMVAAGFLVAWARPILPRTPVEYQWLAVRLLAPLSGKLREQSLKLAPLASLYMRLAPEFEGCWHKVKVGKNRETVVYHAPNQLPLDL